MWKDVPFTNSFIDIEGIKIPKFNTQVKMLWNERYLFIYAQLEEQHISANLTEHDTVIFYDNDFEVFIDPDGDTHNYYEFEFLRGSLFINTSQVRDSQTNPLTFFDPKADFSPDGNVINRLEPH